MKTWSKPTLMKGLCRVTQGGSAGLNDDQGFGLTGS